MVKLNIESRYKTQMIDISSAINEAVITYGKKSGAVNIFVPHTTCSVFIAENQDPNIQRDLLKKLHLFFPNDGQYAHVGTNGDAHMKAAVMGSSLVVPVQNAQLVLGEWQGVFMAEFDGPRERTILVSFLDG